MALTVQVYADGAVIQCGRAALGSDPPHDLPLALHSSPSQSGSPRLDQRYDLPPQGRHPGVGGAP